MKLSEQLRPTTVDEIVGQSHAKAILTAWAADPYPTCWLFTGPPGVGKTSSARAVAADLGVVCQLSGLTQLCCGELTLVDCQRLFSELHFRPLMGLWKCVILEEMELLTPHVQVFFKTALENLPAHTAVFATSNNTKKVQEAVLQRFTEIEFRGDEEFAADAMSKLTEVWKDRIGGNPPSDLDKWGWRDGQFSLRMAYDALQTQILLKGKGAA